MEAITNFLNSTGFAKLGENPLQLVMLAVSCVLLYLAIVKKFEPLLLLPIAFGMLLTNLPGAGIYHAELFEGGHVHWEMFAEGVKLANGSTEAAGLLDVLYLGVKLGVYPCLIFIGVGCMTDFGPLIANPKSLLLGAAAQLGIFVTYVGAVLLGFTPAQAGSIGIIGIALILALSNGVNAYIQSVEEETLSEYPLEIQSTGFDLTSMMAMNMGTDDKDAEKEDDDQVNVVQMITNMFSTMDSNDLKSLKKYLDDHEKKVSKYAKSVEYSYSATPQIFRLDKDRDRIRQVNPDKSFASLGLGSSSSANSMMSSMMSTDVFYEMPREENLYKNQYDVKAGRWPESYDECVVVMTADGSISDFLLYTLGLRDAMELDDMIEQFMKDEDVDTPDNIGTYRYEDILGTTFKLVNASDYYSYDSEYKVWKDKSDNNKYMKKLVKNGEDLKVVGIVQPSEDANGALLRTGIYYPAELTDHVIEKAKNSKIVKAQMKNEDIDVFTNEEFGKESNNDFDMGSLFKIDEDKLQNAFKFDENVMANAMAGSADLSDAFSVDPNTLDLSGMLDLSAINISLPEAPDLSLGNLMSGIKIQASGDDVSNLAAALLKGYQEYAKEHPEADYSGLGENFIGYLNTEKAQEILKNNIKINFLI